MKTLRIVTSLGILFLMLTCVLLLYSETAKAVSTQLENLRIGVCASLSGPTAAWGIACYQTFKTQARFYNEAGGIKIGGKLYKIELVAADDKYMAESGAAAINRLIFQEKVDYIILGGPSTLVGLAAGPICTKNQVIFFGSGTTGPGLSRDWPWSFRLIETEYERNIALVGWLLKNKPEIKRIAYVCQDTEGGHATTEAFLKIIAGSTKWEKVAGEFYEVGSKDYYPILTKVLKEKPDLIYIGTATLGDTGLIAKQSLELGFKKVILQPTIQDARQIASISGIEAAGNIINNSLSYDVTPEVKKLTDAYYKEWGEYNAVNMFACDFLPVLFQAMQKAGSFDKFKVKDALESGVKTGVFHSLVGPGARFYGRERYGIVHQWLRPVCVSRIQKGETQVLATMKSEELLEVMGIKE